MPDFLFFFGGGGKYKFHYYLLEMDDVGQHICEVLCTI